MYYNNNSVIFLNGKFVKANESSTDLYSQTLHYGYGVFEGIRSYNTESGTRIFKAKEHYGRLKKSCELVNIPFSYTKQELVDGTYQLLKENNLTDAYVRPLVFCDQNMSLTKPNNVSIMICAWEWGAYLGHKQLRLAISSYCRPHPRSIKIEAKICGHYVNSILTTSQQKIKQVKLFGKDKVEVILKGDTYDESFQEASRLCNEIEAIFIHPFDDEKVIAGQGTIALELLEDTRHPLITYLSLLVAEV